MKPFVFSVDSHLVEPEDLFLSGLPASLKSHALRSKKEGDYLVTGTDHKPIYRLRIGVHNERELSGNKRIGARDLDARRLDMAKDGVDAEVIFPSLGLWLYCLDEPEAEFASCQVYNNWINGYLSPHLDRFVRCGVLPVRDFANTLSELKRLGELGFTAAMLPSVIPAGLPKYNDEKWDPVFRLAGELGIVFVLHTGTGLESVQSERGPGGALINYTSQMADGLTSVMYLVAGGVLDRNPETQIAVIESGASWLAALAERLDEVNDAHSMFVKPKLSILPSEIIRRQVHCSFQHDRACIMSRAVTGTAAIMFASDYPHVEGTFPITPEVIETIFEGTGATQQEREDILGGNAAKLFRFDRSKIQPQLVQTA